MLVLIFVGLGEISASLVKAKLAEQAALASLQFEFAGLEVIGRRHVDHIAICVFAKESDQLRVDKSAIDSDLVLHKLDEGVPHFECLGQILRHQSL